MLRQILCETNSRNINKIWQPIGIFLFFLFLLIQSRINCACVCVCTTFRKMISFSMRYKVIDNIYNCIIIIMCCLNRINKKKTKQYNKFNWGKKKKNSRTKFKWIWFNHSLTHSINHDSSITMNVFRWQIFFTFLCKICMFSFCCSNVSKSYFSFRSIDFLSLFDLMSLISMTILLMMLMMS